MAERHPDAAAVFLPFGLDSISGKSKNPKSKMKRFSTGGFNQKKSALQRRKEAEEEKKRQADLDTARVYEDFVSSFDTDGGSSRKGPGFGFVRGGTIVGADGIERDHSSHGSKNANVNGNVSSQQRVPQSSQSTPMRVSASASSENPAKKQKTTLTAAPKAASASASASSSVPMEMTSEAFFGGDDEDEEEERLKAAELLAREKKRRNIDSFLAEMKQKEGTAHTHTTPTTTSSSRSRKDTYTSTATSSFVDADTTTATPNSSSVSVSVSTNLFVGRLAPSVTEEALFTEFRKFGTIISIKVMWPRTDEERSRGHNSGFVAFANRSDAEIALSEMNGRRIHGMSVTLCWGKPVPPQSASLPAYMTVESTTAVAAAVGLPPPDMSLLHRPANDYDHTPLPHIRVEFPRDSEMEYRITRTARYVVEHGWAFEAMLIEKMGKMEREKRKRYSFLFDQHTPESRFYRWRVFSLLQGDAIDGCKWRTEPFQMVENGPFWQPPILPKDQVIEIGRRRAELQLQHHHHHRGSDDMSISPSQDRGLGGRADNDSKPRSHSHSHSLSSRAYRAMNTMLDSITQERRDVMHMMGFALDHADSSAEIVDMIIERYVKVKGKGERDELDPSIQVALLFAISDILHNSSALIPHASSYRTALESQLPLIFDVLGVTHRSLHGRLAAEKFKDQITTVLRVWGLWCVYNEEYIHSLGEIFKLGIEKASEQLVGEGEGEGEEESVPVLSVQGEGDDVGADEEEEEEDIDGVPIEDEEEDEEDIDGIPIDML